MDYVGDGITDAKGNSSVWLGESQATDSEMGIPKVPSMAGKASEASDGRNLCTEITSNM